jgi:dTDP-4-amino-4,6-dideoxygalactose transaminase
MRALASLIERSANSFLALAFACMGPRRRDRESGGTIRLVETSSTDDAAPPATAVPFVDLVPTTEAVRAEFLDRVVGLLDRGAFVNGPEVERFEKEFAAYCGVRCCVGTGSGLDALRLGLLAAGIRPGDEVIVPAQTFIATFEAVTQAGGTPIVVDVAESDYNLDVAAVEAAVGSRTRFLLPVHLYGQLSDMTSLRKIASDHSLFVLEDACQAHGAVRDGLAAGKAGDAAAFSFYPTKNLGAFGDAGALVTDHEDLARLTRALRQHGEVSKYRSVQPGYTARLDALQALALTLKLPYLDAWTADRKLAAGFYSRALEDVGDLVLPPVPAGSDPAWHLYVVRTGAPEALATFLRARGIATGRHYPEIPTASAAYSGLGFGDGAFPVAESLAREGLSLPIFAGISQAQLERVVAAIVEYFG